MIKLAALAIVILGFSVAGCVSSARFAPTQPQGYQVTPQQAPGSQPGGERRDLGGPYDRAREDREYGRQP
jgi:hypothetical protein